MTRAPSALLLSLIPWASYLGAVVIGDLWADDRSLSLLGLTAAAPVYLAFVALPSALPIAAAHGRAARVAVTALMSTAAATAGVLVVTTDDAQAGLAVLLVLYAAIPLAAVVAVGQYVASRLNR